MAPKIPVSALSVSSIRELRKCPERWRRRYVERQTSPPSGPMFAGSAAGAAANATDHHYIEKGEFLPADDALDVFSDEWDERLEREGEDTEWGDEKPGTLKDLSAKALGSYIDLLEDLPKPIAVEREARLVYEGVEFVAYLDREQHDGSIADRKVSGKRSPAGAADADLQATAYVAVRRAEAEAGLAGEPTGFEFHRMIRQKKAVTEGTSTVIEPTERTAGQLDAFLAGLYGAAEEIEFRLETDNWSFAPDGAWWCSEKSCGYWSQCAGGGLLRQRAAQAVAAA
jgi:hypothetical protein